MILISLFHYERIIFNGKISTSVMLLRSEKNQGQSFLTFFGLRHFSLAEKIGGTLICVLNKFEAS